MAWPYTSTLRVQRHKRRDFVGCDIDPGAVDIARSRIEFWTPERHRAVLRDSQAICASAEREQAAREAGQLTIGGIL